jgi:hypothetical protein
MGRGGVCVRGSVSAGALRGVTLSKDDLTYEFHHIGIPTREVRDGERYSPLLRMYTSDDACGTAKVQWHRFETDSPIHPLVQSVPHAAFKVNNLDRAVEGRTVLLGPYEPIEQFRVAMILDGGVPVELIETSLSDEEIWKRAISGKRAKLYRNTSEHSGAVIDPQS